MAKKVQVSHGAGPLTTIVGRRETVEVEWDARIERLVDNGRLKLVGRRPAKKKEKPIEPAEVDAENSDETPEVAAGFTGALTDTGDFKSDHWMGD